MTCFIIKHGFTQFDTGPLLLDALEGKFSLRRQGCHPGHVPSLSEKPVYMGCDPELSLLHTQVAHLQGSWHTEDCQWGQQVRGVPPRTVSDRHSFLLRRPWGLYRQSQDD